MKFNVGVCLHQSGSMDIVYGGILFWSSNILQGLLCDKDGFEYVVHQEAPQHWEANLNQSTNIVTKIHLLNLFATGLWPMKESNRHISNQKLVLVHSISIHHRKILF